MFVDDDVGHERMGAREIGLDCYLLLVEVVSLVVRNPCTLHCSHDCVSCCLRVRAVGIGECLPWTVSRRLAPGQIVFVHYHRAVAIVLDGGRDGLAGGFLYYGLRLLTVSDSGRVLERYVSVP